MQITFEANTLTASEDDRIISGILVPYGEQGKSNLGAFSVPRGALELPTDPAQIGTNVEHQREAAFGHGVTLTDSPKGVMFAARAAHTPEGDQALADVKSGKRTHWSVEAKNLVIEAGKAVSGRIFGAALVEKPAFPSATLLAALTEDLEGNTEISLEDPEAEPAEGEPEETIETHVDEYTDEDGNTVTETRTTTTVVDGNTTTITTETEIVETPTEDPDPQQEENIVTTLTASARRGATRTHRKPADEPGSMGLTAFCSLIADAASTQSTSTLLAALSDIPFTGTTARALGTNTTVPEWLGQLWSGTPNPRRVIPLLGSGTINGISAEGWRFTTEPQVGEWAGNKTAVPSGNVEVEKVAYPFQRFAGAWDIAREYVDFGVTEVIEAFLSKAAENYKKKSDTWALTQLKAFATTAEVGTLPTDVPEVIGKLVRGALRVINEDALPSYALIAPDLYEQLLFTKKDDVLAYLEMSLGLSEGSVDTFALVPEKRLAAGEIIVGAKEAASFDELAASPIRVNALDIAKGGVDEALFGYGRFRGEYAGGVQLVTTNEPVGG